MVLGRVVLDPNQAPTYEQFIEEMRTQWIDQFTEAERAGPIPFTQYLTEGISTLQWRVTEEIPGRIRAGTVSETEAGANIEFIQTLIQYIERYLKNV